MKVLVILLVLTICNSSFAMFGEIGKCTLSNGKILKILASNDSETDGFLLLELTRTYAYEATLENNGDSVVVSSDQFGEFILTQGSEIETKILKKKAICNARW